MEVPPIKPAESKPGVPPHLSNKNRVHKPVLSKRPMINESKNEDSSIVNFLTGNLSFIIK